MANLKRIMKADRAVCRHKWKLSPDELAMQRLARTEGLDRSTKKITRPLSMYLCTCCGFIHLGHERKTYRH
jgi:hypothetical protein